MPTAVIYVPFALNQAGFGEPADPSNRRGVREFDRVCEPRYADPLAASFRAIEAKDDVPGRIGKEIIGKEMSPLAARIFNAAGKFEKVKAGRIATSPNIDQPGQQPFCQCRFFLC